jgi:hypothetical protein
MSSFIINPILSGNTDKGEMEREEIGLISLILFE